MESFSSLRINKLKMLAKSEFLIIKKLGDDGWRV